MAGDPSTRSPLTDGTTIARGVLGVLAELSAILVALHTFAVRVDEATEDWWPWGRWLLVAALAALGAALAWPYLQALSRRPRVVQPGRFRLDPTNPAHLVGREDDISAVERACLDAPLLWLTGESGVGKSALVRAGLVPKMGKNGRLLPVYLDSWGRDWETSPRRALTDALWAALGPEGQERMGLQRPPTPEKLAEVLERVHEKLGRTPLLLFDQFDDYQARHRARFLPNARTWLRAEKLEERNSFWRDVAELVRHDSVHAVFITRDDAAIGLESVRFDAPERLSLFRLPPAFVTTILDRVTAEDDGPVIQYPERGWERLKQRLKDDLARGEAVLPQQVKTVLLGLRHLAWLTVGSYQRAGELAGIEALHVQSEVGRVCGTRSPSLHPAQARALLLALVDNADPSKTSARSFADLVEQVNKLDSNGGSYRTPVSLEQVKGALSAFEAAELVRARTDPDSREQVWELDHDYLCRAVLQAERTANRSTTLLRDGHEEFRRAGRRLRRRWRALLGVWPQIRLAWLRLLGRFRYGEHRGYAAWSLLRFAPFIAALTVLVLMSLGWQQFEGQRTAARADEIWQGLVLNSNDLPPSEVNRLWELASAPEGVRDAAIAKIITSTAIARKFGRHPKLVVRAAVGLDPEFRDHVLREHVANALITNGGDELRFAQLSLGLSLGMRSERFHQRIVDEVARNGNRSDVDDLTGQWLVQLRQSNQHWSLSLLAYLTRAIRTTSNQAAIKPLGEGLEAVVVRLDATQAVAAAEIIGRALERSQDLHVVRALAGALRALAERTVSLSKQAPPGAVTAVVAVVTTAMGQVRDPHALQALSEALQVSAANLDQVDAATAVRGIARAMRGSTDLGQVSIALLRALRGVALKLQGHEVAEAVAAAVEDGRKWDWDQDAVRTLAGVLENAATLDATAARSSAAKAIRAAMIQKQNPRVVWALVGILTALPDVSKRMAADTAAGIAAAMTQEENPQHVRPLAEALRELAPTLDATEAAMAAEAVAQKMDQTEDLLAVRALAGALRAMTERLGLLPEDLPWGMATEVSVAVAEAMKQMQDPQSIRALAEVLRTLAMKVGTLPNDASPAVATEVSAAVIGAIRQTQDPKAVRTLAEGLRALPEVPPAASIEVLRAAVEAIAASRNSEAVQILSPIIKELSETTPGAASEAVQVIVAAMEGARDFETARTLWSATRVLSEVTPRIAEAIIAAIQNAREPWALAALSLGLASLSEMTSTSWAAAAPVVAAAVKEAPDPEVLGLLGLGVGCLPGTASDVTDTAEAISSAVSDAPDERALVVLGLGLAAVASKLDNTTARQVVVAAAQQAGDPENLKALALGFNALPVVAPRFGTPVAAQAIATAMEETHDPETLKELAEALGELPEVPPRTAAAAAGAIVAATQGAADPHDLTKLAEALKELPEVPQEPVAEAAGLITAAVREQPGSTRLDALSDVLTNVAQLAPAVAAEVIATGIRDETNPLVLVSLARALGALTEAPPDALAVAAETITARLGASPADRVIDDLASALGALAPKLSGREAIAAADAIAVAMKETARASNIGPLTAALVALPEVPPLPASVAAEASIRALTEEWLHPLSVVELSKALVALPNLPLEASAAAARAIASKVEEAENEDQLDALRVSLQLVMTGSMSMGATEISLKTLEEIEFQLAKTTNSDKINALIGMSRTVIPPLYDAQAADQIFRLLKFPTVAETSDKLLQLLEENIKPAAPFNGDLWAAVGWAESRGIDVRDPPQLLRR